MNNYNYNKVKQFWTDQINNLISVEKPADAFHYWKGIKDSWRDNLNDKKSLSDIANAALRICQIIYTAGGKWGSITSDLSQSLDNLGVKNQYLDVLQSQFSDFEQELTNLQTELANYKNKWDGHVCSSTSCSHSDYDALKGQQDNLKTQIVSLTNEKSNLQTELDRLKEQLDGQSDFDKIKKNVTQQIIGDSELSLDKESNLEQLITKIKELVKNKDSSSGSRERERERETI